MLLEILPFALLEGRVGRLQLSVLWDDRLLQQLLSPQSQQGVEATDSDDLHLLKIFNSFPDAQDFGFRHK